MYVYDLLRSDGSRWMTVCYLPMALAIAARADTVAGPLTVRCRWEE